MNKTFPIVLWTCLLSVAAQAQAFPLTQTNDAPQEQKRNESSNSDKNACCVDQTNFYAKIFGGANFLQNATISGNTTRFEPGYLFSGSLGYTWRHGLHIEGEYAYRRNAVKTIHFFSEGSSNRGHYQSSSYMANLLWYLPLCSWGYSLWNIRPLFGAGVGCDSQHQHATNSRIVFSQKWHHLSWQLMAGLSFPIYCNTEFTLEYKFHQAGSHFNNHAVGLGLTYKFLLK